MDVTYKLRGCFALLFNSYEFIFLFLPITVVGFFLISKRSHALGTLWLVAASLFFYGWWDVRYVPLLCASIGFNYLVGGRIERLAAGHAITPGEHVASDVPHAAARKGWLAFGIVINVLLLGYFKYMDFFLGTMNALAGANLFDLPHIVLPLGISFFTFTQTAYLVDAYRGQAKNESLLTYCEFVTIFPHLIAGPITNHREMIPQFVADATFRVNWDNTARGITIFTSGLFNKVVIADSIAPWVNGVFARADALTFLEAWIGALGYTLQLYFDFSGYSEMAIGLGLMLNLKLPVNFNSPYQALSVIDFWRRWHMTLGLWVKNYLYIPMGGGRCGVAKKMRNLFCSMLIIGLWHGAGWTFVFWGGLHGIMLMINHLWRLTKIELPKVLCWAMTFLGVVVCWVFFRAENFHDAWCVLVAMTDVHQIVLPLKYLNTWGFLQNLGVSFVPLASNIHVGTMLLNCIGLLFLTLFAKNPLHLIAHFHSNWKWFLPIVGLALYPLYKMDRFTEFLYFQF